jgi:hypothetical protein
MHVTKDYWDQEETQLNVNTGIAETRITASRVEPNTDISSAGISY